MNSIVSKSYYKINIKNIINAENDRDNIFKL